MTSIRGSSGPSCRWETIQLRPRQTSLKFIFVRVEHSDVCIVSMRAAVRNLKVVSLERSRTTLELCLLCWKSSPHRTCSVTKLAATNICPVQLLVPWRPTPPSSDTLDRYRVSEWARRSSFIRLNNRHTVGTGSAILRSGIWSHAFSVKEQEPARGLEHDHGRTRSTNDMRSREAAA